MKNGLNSAKFILGLSAVVISINSPLGIAATDNLPTATKMPTRIPRPFFEKSVTGTLTASSNDQAVKLSIDTPIVWQEEPTTLPAPQAGAIADYRDFTGCAYYDHLDVAVCFNVMPDVSSIGVNAKEMSLRGVEDYINNELSQASDCRYKATSIEFSDAQRVDNQVTIEFKGELVPESDCENGSTQPMHLKFQLKSV